MDLLESAYITGGVSRESRELLYISAIGIGRRDVIDQFPAVGRAVNSVCAVEGKSGGRDAVGEDALVPIKIVRHGAVVKIVKHIVGGEDRCKKRQTKNTDKKRYCPSSLAYQF